MFINHQGKMINTNNIDFVETIEKYPTASGSRQKLIIHFSGSSRILSITKDLEEFKRKLEGRPVVN